MECLIPHKHTLKILYKSTHFPLRYKRKREWVFSEVQTKDTCPSICWTDIKALKCNVIRAEILTYFGRFFDTSFILWATRTETSNIKPNRINNKTSSFKTIKIISVQHHTWSYSTEFTLYLRSTNVNNKNGTQKTHQDGIRIPPFNVTGIVFLKQQINFNFNDC